MVAFWTSFVNIGHSMPSCFSSTSYLPAVGRTLCWSKAARVSEAAAWGAYGGLQTQTFQVLTKFYHRWSENLSPFGFFTFLKEQLTRMKQKPKKRYQHPMEPIKSLTLDRRRWAAGQPLGQTRKAPTALYPAGRQTFDGCFSLSPKKSQKPHQKHIHRHPLQKKHVDNVDFWNGYDSM